MTRAAAWSARLVRLQHCLRSSAALLCVTCRCAQTPGGAGSALWTQDGAPAARCDLVASLPPALLARLAAVASRPLPAPADAAAAAAVASAVTAARAPDVLLRAALAATVRASSRRQAVAGLFTAGLGNAARYVGRKVAKAWWSRAGAAARVTS